VFFGLVATTGTTFVVCERITATSWLAGCAAGCLACALLVVNNLRDIPTDRVAGKRTLAVRIGDRRTRALYVVLLVAAFALVATIAVDGRRWTALGLLGVALAIKPVRTIAGGAQGGALIPVLGGTGKVQLATGLLAALGIALGG
jgi:1,4-dihydroxy-2-naphthoate octaprenyltransferase